MAGSSIRALMFKVSLLTSKKVLIRVLAPVARVSDSPGRLYGLLDEDASVSQKYPKTAGFEKGPNPKETLPNRMPAGGSLGGLRTATAGAACRRLVPVSKSNGSTPHAGEDKAPRNTRSGAIRWLENGMRTYRNHHDGAAMAHDAPL